MSVLVPSNFSLVTLPASLNQAGNTSPPTTGPAMDFTARFQLAVAAAQDRYRLPSMVVVDNRACFTNGIDQPWYYNEIDGKNYALGGYVAVAPSTVDSPGTTFPPGTILDYYCTNYDLTFDMETAPAVYSHTTTLQVDVLHNFTGRVNPPGYDYLRFYRKLTGGNYKLVATVPVSAQAWLDNYPESALLTQPQVVLRFRQTPPPIFDGWLSHYGAIIGWTGFDSTLHVSQERRVDGLGNRVVDWPETNIVPVEPNDGYGFIVGCFAQAETVYVFKQHAIYRVNGGPSPLDMNIELIATNRGCISQHSIVAINGFLFFLDREGVYILPPGGMPTPAGASVGGSVSPLAPIWQRANLAARHLAKGSHNLTSGTYELLLPLDDDPEPSIRAIFDYRSGADRWSIDVFDGQTWQGSVIDATGNLAILGMDDLGTIMHVDRDQGDLIPPTGDYAGTVIGGDHDVLNVIAAWGGPMTGAPLHLRSADGTVIYSNRCFVADEFDGSVSLVYWRPGLPVPGNVVYMGVIPAAIRTPDMIFGDVRREKRFKDISTLHKRQSHAGTLAVRCFQDEDSGTLLDAIRMDQPDGHEYVYPSGVQAYRMSLQFDNANANEPWELSGVDFDVTMDPADYT